ncbi:MAG: tetraacyldisaccharide 4'-kinase [Candidatus Desulfofervidaceae bacterium]|nr:tetraacyldisaccharide 4'-kinase [Candidatus Desulfofervidaceae bacterium]
MAHSLSALYLAGLKLHQFVYKTGWLPQRQAPCKVISVGNLSVGGTGKTPFTIFLACLMQELGKKVVVVTRGYKSKSKETLISDGQRVFLSPLEAGDEGYLLAKNLPGIPVLKGKNRHQVINFAWKHFRPDIAILDDAFQHYALKRDLDIVLLDTESPFGNGYLLPRGTLREPISALNRAQAVVLTKIKDESRAGELKQYLTHHFPHLKIFTTLRTIETFFFLSSSPINHHSFPIARYRYLAFCGLAQPQDFYQTCHNLGVHIVHFLPFPDHYCYKQKDIEMLIEKAKEKKADALITTEKDAVKLIPFTQLFCQMGFEVFYPQIKISVHEKGAFSTWIKDQLGF